MFWGSGDRLHRLPGRSATSSRPYPCCSASASICDVYGSSPHAGGAFQHLSITPKRLVVTGLYQYVRNPMYVGVMLFLLGEALFFGSLRFLLYAIAWLLFVHANVLLYEEPNLRRKFGNSYELYTSAVHRWIPGKKYRPAA